MYGSNRYGGHLVKVGLRFRTGGSLELGSLHLDTLHTLAEVDFAAQKQFVVVTTGIITTCEARKAVKVQLTLKGGGLGLAKVLGITWSTNSLGL